jgi:hypothetical protein
MRTAEPASPNGYAEQGVETGWGQGASRGVDASPLAGHSAVPGISDANRPSEPLPVARDTGRVATTTVESSGDHIFRIERARAAAERADQLIRTVHDVHVSARN